jgi:predicted MFS family arabinose efflux permease
LRFVLLGCIPLAAFFHVLNIIDMYVIAFLVGSFTIFFDVAYRSYLPSLIERNQLLDGNSKLELTSSMTQLIGPGFGGFLVQIFTAPISMLADAFSFLLSAISLLMVRTVEPPVVRTVAKTSMASEIREGLKSLLGQVLLAPIVWCSINITLFLNITSAVYLLYATDVLHLSPIVLGIIYAVGGLGAIPGAIISRWITRRLGMGKTLVIVVAVYSLSALLVPLASGSQLVIIGMLLVWQALTGITFVIWNINQLSLRQTLTPNALLGRMNATYRFLVWGVLPIGSLIGGTLGTILGLHTTLLIGTLGTLVSPVWLFFSPVRKFQQLPTESEETMAVEGER